MKIQKRVPGRDEWYDVPAEGWHDMGVRDVERECVRLGIDSGRVLVLPDGGRALITSVAYLPEVHGAHVLTDQGRLPLGHVRTALQRGARIETIQ